MGESGKSHHHHYPPPYLEPHDFQVGRVGNPEMICVGGSTSGGGGGGRDRKNLFSSLKGPAPTTPSLFGHQIQQTAPKRHHYLHQQHVVSIDVKDEEDDRMKFSQQLSMRESTEKPALHSSVQSSTPLSLFLFKSGISGPQPLRNTEETLSNLASNTNTNDDDEQNCQKRLEKKANKDRNDMTKEQPTNTGRLAFLLSSPPSSCFPTSEPLLVIIHLIFSVVKTSQFKPIVRSFRPQTTFPFLYHQNRMIFLHFPTFSSFFLLSLVNHRFLYPAL